MQPFLTGGLPKAGSILTVNTGLWEGGWGTVVPSFMWFLGSASAYASASAASYSVSANNSATGLSCRIRMGNASWGTTDVWARTGTCIP